MPPQEAGVHAQLSSSKNLEVKRQGLFQEVPATICVGGKDFHEKCY